MAMQLLTQSKRNVSAPELRRPIGVWFRTAWLVKHKLLDAMHLAEAVRQLTGCVEIDDTLRGGAHSGGKAGRGSENNVPFVAAVPTTEDGMPHLACVSLRPFAQAAPAEFFARSASQKHRVHRLQWPGLPGADLGHHAVGDEADEVRRHLGAVLLGQEALDLVHGHAACAQGHDLVVEAGEAPIVLGHEQRLEGALAVAGHLDAQRAILGQHGLATGTVAMVAGVLGLVRPGRIAQVMRQLGTQGTFDQLWLAHKFWDRLAVTSDRANFR
jgi:hypothetical protein